MPKSNFKMMKMTHVLTFPNTVSLVFSFFALQNNKNVQNQHPCASGILDCTINLTLTYFYALFTHKMVRNRKKMSHLVFSPCHCGLSCLDMGWTQIFWCWLATTSPGAGLASIPLCSLAYWNMWPFIIENWLISIPGQLKITMHLLVMSKPEVIAKLSKFCSDICMITPLLKNLWLVINIFGKW